MARKHFLAVDLGAESGRTLLADFDGERFALEETHRFPNGPVRVADTLYWDVLRLWQEIQDGIAATVRHLKARNPGGPHVPTSIGVDTWGVDFGFVDPHGALVRNPVHYRDDRTDGMMELAFSIVPKADIYRTTGLQFLKFNTLFQLLAVSRQKGKLDGVDKLLFMPDLFNHFLTGQRVAEYTIASTSQMLDAHTRTWATELLRMLGLPREVLPEVVPTGRNLGSLLRGVAAETGAEGMQVIASAGHDTAAAVAAVPVAAVAEGNWCYISSGTWSLMGAELPEPTITDATLADNWTNEGGIGGTYRFLKNIMGLWLVQQCRRSFAKAGRDYGYDELTRLAEQSPAFGPLVDPDDADFLNPPDMAAAIQAFCNHTGQTPPNTEGSIIRCCLESLALRYRQTLEQMEKHAGRRFETIHIVGGGTQNELLCQLTADSCQRLVVTGPIEATALGNVIVQAMAAGELGSLADGREIVRRSFAVKTFEPRDAGAWDDAYGRFQALGS